MVALETFYPTFCCFWAEFFLSPFCPLFLPIEQDEGPRLLQARDPLDCWRTPSFSSFPFVVGGFRKKLKDFGLTPSHLFPPELGSTTLSLAGKFTGGTLPSPTGSFFPCFSPPINDKREDESLLLFLTSTYFRSLTIWSLVRTPRRVVPDVPSRVRIYSFPSFLPPPSFDWIQAQAAAFCDF